MSSSGPDNEFERQSAHAIALDLHLPLSLYQIFSTQGSLDDSARVTRMLAIRNMWKQSDVPLHMGCHRRMISVQLASATISHEDISLHCAHSGPLAFWGHWNTYRLPMSCVHRSTLKTRRVTMHCPQASMIFIDSHERLHRHLRCLRKLMRDGSKDYRERFTRALRVSRR